MLSAYPDFFLVGTPKAGTTSIYKYMDQHPEIFVPLVKEPNYFTDFGPNCKMGTNIKDLNKYLSLYTTAQPFQKRGDFSVSYMHDHQAYMKIHECNPNAKIIMVIRQPVNRAYSHWLMDKREGFTDGEFYNDFLKDVNFEGKKGFCYNSMYYDCSLYADDIEKYRSLFSDVLVLVYEEIFTDMQKTMESIYSFLNVDNINNHNLTRYNESGEVKNKLFKWIYANKAARRIFRVIIPENFKGSFREKIMVKSDSKINEADFGKTVSYFKDDVIKVRELLSRPNLWPEIQ